MKYPIILVAPKFMKLVNIINAGIVDTQAITLFPFIISREPMNEATTRHESIHILQQAEMYVIFFYLVYLWDYIVGYIKLGNLSEAYYNIRFEQEAYDNHYDVDYLENRKPFAWKNYKL